MKKKNQPKEGTAPAVMLIDIELIDLAPELAHVPTLRAAAEMEESEDEDCDGRRYDWRRLLASVQEHGLIEPVKVKAAGERWHAIDGRSRMEAARECGMGQVPCIVLEGVEAETIAAETMKRRQVPSFVAAYIFCRKNEAVLCAAKRGGDRTQSSKETLLTQDQAAEICRCRKETIVACVAALKHFRSHPADRAADEPRILAGLMHPSRYIQAAAGRAATAGTTRRPTSYVSWLPKWRSMVSNLRGFDQWSPEDQENARALVTAEAAEWPESFRAIVAAAIK